MMRSGNPVLNDKTFGGAQAAGPTMTIAGTVNKTAMLLAMMMITAVYVWNQYFTTNDPSAVVPYIIGGAIAGLVLSLVTMFAKRFVMYTAPLYALCQGLAVGGISAFYEAKFPGLVIQAVGLTFGTLASLLVAYRSGFIEATENFKLGVVAATGGIMLLYLVNIVMGFFGNSIGFIHESGTFGILFSGFVVVIAALNLVLDFDFIEEGARQGAPKYMEWYGAFGLVVTLVWLYMEILRLLSKLRSR